MQITAICPQKVMQMRVKAVGICPQKVKRYLDTLAKEVASLSVLEGKTLTVRVRVRVRLAVSEGSMRIGRRAAKFRCCPV